MDLILIDWTRMGKTYCLAGAIVHNGTYRIVRPLLAQHQKSAVRNVGWSPFLLDGHSRWEVFEVVGPTPAEVEPPHCEDVWVHTLRPRRCLATPAQRRAVLQVTLTPEGQPPFGAPLATTRSSAYLAPGCGSRSLATLLVPARGIRFSAALREGAAEPDYRVTLDVPGLAGRQLPVKDHFLLRQAEMASTSLDFQVRALTRAVQQMGERIAIRLGLSRAFQPTPGRGSGFCWLMADGFFSFTDPQP